MTPAGAAILPVAPYAKDAGAPADLFLRSENNIFIHDFEYFCPRQVFYLVSSEMPTVDSFTKFAAVVSAPFLCYPHRGISRLARSTAAFVFPLAGAAAWHNSMGIGQ